MRKGGHPTPSARSRLRPSQRENIAKQGKVTGAWQAARQAERDANPKESWWLDLSRPEFAARASAEQARMRVSKAGSANFGPPDGYATAIGR
jgi:hypothetical protein